MQVFDEINKKFIAASNSKRTVVDVRNGTIIYGYVPKGSEIVTFAYIANDYYDGSYELLKDKLIYSNRCGVYMLKANMSLEDIINNSYRMGRGDFPYSFSRKYEAIENFDIFDNKQKILNPEVFLISKYFKYTFGLEFETSMGYVPERICYRDGLIPLRDGSISGLEYSTVVLNGNNGLCLLKQQLNSLKEYTAFDKECSLHIHMGNFPLEPGAIFNVYKIFYSLQEYIAILVPPLTFRGEKYKGNGKNYCKRLEIYRDFDEMYLRLVGVPFFGDLMQPHPKDLSRSSKWHVDTRYYAVNFINMLCYSVNKTIEFRFLRPTYNFNKILVWLAIFNAILEYAERGLPIPSRDKLRNIIIKIYDDPEIRNFVLEGIYKLSVLTSLQDNNGDLIGRDINFEDKLFNDGGYN